MQRPKCVNITPEAYAALVRLAEQEAGKTGRFTALGKVASKLILETKVLDSDQDRP